ncbi:Serine/threonine-protein phosphatase 7 long form-like protein, partial [Bienertia sinuspersici]
DEQSRKKNRVHNRAIVAFVRAAHTSRRSSQHHYHGSNGSSLVINNNKSNNVEEIIDGEADDIKHGEIGVKRTWNKKPRTFDCILTELAPGGPLSTELLRGYRGYLVSLLGCIIFIDKIVDRISTLLFSMTRDLVSFNTYLWALMTLAYLYRELKKASRAGCKQLAGPTTLLEALNPWDSLSDYMQWFLHRSYPKVQKPVYASKGYKSTQHYLSAKELILNCYSK